MKRVLVLSLLMACLTSRFSILPPVQAQMPQSPGVGDSQPAQPGDSTPTVAEVQAAIDALDADASLDETIKASLKQKYQQALEALESAASFAAQRQEFSRAIEGGPARIEELQDELAGVEPEDLADSQVNTTPAELQREINSRQVAVELLRKQLTEAVEEATRLEQRTVEIPARLREVQRLLSETRERLASPELAPADESVSAAAERVSLQAREAQLAGEQAMLEEEQRSQSIRLDLLTARQALLERQVAISESSLEQLNNELQLLVSNMAERIRRVANSVPEELIQEDAFAESLVVEVRELADKLQSAIRDEAQLEARQEASRQARENLVVEFTTMQEQLELDSNGEVVIQLLFNLDRRCLAALRELRSNPISGLEEARLGTLRVREKLRDQPELERRLDAEPVPLLRDVLAVRREALEELGRRFADLTRSVVAAEQERQEYLEQIKEIREYIDETLFGFGLRACPPVSADTILSLPQALGWSFQPAHWSQVGNAILAAFRRSPLFSLGILLMIGALLLVQPRLASSLEATGSRNRRISTDRYRNTVQAVGWTFLLALPIPLLIGYIGWALGQSPASSDWFAGMRAGIHQATSVVLATALIMAVLRPGGLADLHFGWREARLVQVRQAVLRTAVVYVPALVLTISCTYGDASSYLHSLGRVAFLFAHLWALFQVFRLFRAGRGTSASTTDSDGVAEDESGRTAARWRWICFGLLFVALLAIVGMIVVGYVITSLIWSLGVVVTLMIVAAGSALYGLVVRWFSIRHRRLAFEEALQRRRVRQEAQGDEGPSEIVDVQAEEESEFSLDMVGEQTKQLLRSSFSLAVLIAVAAFWSAVLPLDRLVGSVTLPLLGGLSLRALLLAILVVAVTVIVVKNLPGFLELIVFRSNNVQPGTRLAIYTLCQYGTIAIGTIAFASVVQVDWVQFGWIVTALSVGIGFGLQEVVANFVSGLILLLERPIRVGDVVTVEATTGTVKKIHLRATTITNWDRQEFIVPNRTLITNTLLNWTLSAPLNRIAIPVGISYGGDTEQARKILLAVAGDHPNVLADPGPMATFEQFGDSSLNIILRAYLPDLDARLSTISELHTEIHQRFADAGIEIPFPQRDLHLRSGWKEPLA